jgi:hypothetical protein
MLVFKTTQIAGIAIILGVAYLLSIYPGTRYLLLPLPAWFIAYIAAGVWLNRFRCPRCRKLYYWRLELKGYMRRLEKWRDCRHCGLAQDAVPI